MNILYISSLSSEGPFSAIFQRIGYGTYFAARKFHKLLATGFVKNKVETHTLSIPPIPSNFKNKLFVHFDGETEDCIDYRYVPYFNIPFLKQICIFFYTFFYVLFWGLSNRKDKKIVCSVLCVSASMASLLATKINCIESIGVVTDIYGLTVNETGKRSLFFLLAEKVNAFYISRFDKYVLLTEQMNEIVNPRNKPHIVMEALCDASNVNADHSPVRKDFPKSMLYAGSLYVKYGVKLLVEAFIESGVDGKLIIYGSGPYAGELRKVCSKCNKIDYRGAAANEEVVAAELKASVLVNPRFTTEPFSPYSFPSKNMEYMASGTPLLTTKLPGVPEEYHKYVYLFGEETTEGYADAIRQVFSKSDDELAQKGLEAKTFVLENKNNVIQAKRILELINE